MKLEKLFLVSTLTGFLGLTATAPAADWIVLFDGKPTGLITRQDLLAFLASTAGA